MTHESNSVSDINQSYPPATSSLILQPHPACPRLQPPTSPASNLEPHLSPTSNLTTFTPASNRPSYNLNTSPTLQPYPVSTRISPVSKLQLRVGATFDLTRLQLHPVATSNPPPATSSLTRLQPRTSPASNLQLHPIATSYLTRLCKSGF